MRTNLATVLIAALTIAATYRNVIGSGANNASTRRRRASAARKPGTAPSVASRGSSVRSKRTSPPTPSAGADLSSTPSSPSPRKSMAGSRRTSVRTESSARRQRSTRGSAANSPAQPQPETPASEQPPASDEEMCQRLMSLNYRHWKGSHPRKCLNVHNTLFRKCRRDDMIEKEKAKIIFLINVFDEGACNNLSVDQFIDIAYLLVKVAYGDSSLDPNRQPNMILGDDVERILRTAEEKNRRAGFFRRHNTYWLGVDRFVRSFRYDVPTHSLVAYQKRVVALAGAVIEFLEQAERAEIKNDIIGFLPDASPTSPAELSAETAAGSTVKPSPAAARLRRMSGSSGTSSVLRPLASAGPPTPGPQWVPEAFFTASPIRLERTATGSSTRSSTIRTVRRASGESVASVAEPVPTYTVHRPLLTDSQRANLARIKADMNRPEGYGFYKVLSWLIRSRTYN